MFWDWAIAEPNQRYFRLLFQVDGLSMFGSLRFSPETRQDAADVWTSLIDSAAARSPRDENPSPGRSTLIMGALNGLLQDRLSTGDHARTSAALAELIDWVGEDRSQSRRRRARSEA
jgi:hypothetical protein